MKMRIRYLLVLLVIGISFGFTANRSANEHTGVVQQYKGLDVYIFSKPTTPYEVIDESKFVFFADCFELYDTPVRKAKKKGADAVIIPDLNKAYYQAIKYKQ